VTRPAPIELPRLDGRRFVVTGGGAGLGYFTSERLAGLGARVTIAARSAERAAAAIAAIRTAHPGALVDHRMLDLASLASVRDAAAALADDGPIDGLVANAGALPWDRPGDTAEGHEGVFGTNQLGHFALMARLWPALAPGAALVALGSTTHRRARLDFADLESRRASPMRRYGRSKLAVMTTAVELDRRVRAAGLDRRSLMAHPGYASDALDVVRPGPVPSRGVATGAFRLAIRGWANSKREGAEIVAAAAVLGAGGELWGPTGGLFGLKGAPRREPLAGAVLDPEAGSRLWSASEELSGVEWLIAPAR